MINTFREVYRYREMLKNLVRKDLRTRYKGSVLGFFWTFLNPLLQLVVYTIVFSTVMRIGVDKFYIFLFVGLVPWTFFSSSILAGANSIVANSNLIKKIYFPKIIIPIAVVNTNFVNMIFTLIIVFISLIFSGIGIDFKIIYLPFVLAIEYVLVLSITVLIASLTVYLRDLEHIFSILLMAWFYLTPIVYPLEMIPEKFLIYFKTNPMFYIINSIRDILFYHNTPDIENLVLICLLSIGLLVISIFLFIRLEKGFAEEI